MGNGRRRAGHAINGGIAVIAHLAARGLDPRHGDAFGIEHVDANIG